MRAGRAEKIGAQRGDGAQSRDPVDRRRDQRDEACDVAGVGAEREELLELVNQERGALGEGDRRHPVPPQPCLELVGVHPCDRRERRGELREWPRSRPNVRHVVVRRGQLPLKAGVEQRALPRTRRSDEHHQPVAAGTLFVEAREHAERVLDESLTAEEAVTVLDAEAGEAKVWVAVARALGG
jgi:hypothetical protein